MARLNNPEPSETDDFLDGIVKHAQAGRCVNGVTHDINNYLGAIMAYAELVQMDPALKAESSRMLSEILSAVRKSTSLLGTLTTIARKDQPNISIVDPSQLVERVLAVGDYEMKINHVSLQTTIQENMGAIILDEPRITRSLIALVMNALNLVDESEDKRLHVSVQADAETVEIVLSTSVDPLPEPEQESLFNPIRESGPSAPYWLGLHEAREVARSHKGDLVYDPARGFVMRLPRDNDLAV